MLPGIAGNAGFVGENGGGAGGITFVGSTSYALAVGTSPDTLTLPGTPLEDDIVIALLGCDANIYSDGAGIQGAAGYTDIDFASAAGPSYQLSYKIMGTTPDTTVDVSEQSAKMTAVILMVFRGVDTTTPLDVATIIATGATGMPDCGSITPTTDACEILALGVLDDDQGEGGASAPSGYGNFIVKETSGGANANATVYAASKNLASVAAENPGVFGGSDDDQWRAYTVALRPA